MAYDSGLPSARFARSLLVKQAAPELVVTEAASFGAKETPPGLAVEAVEPKLESLVPRQLPEGISPDEVEAVARKVLRDDDLSPRESFVTEAIIIPDLRPAVFVIGNDYDVDHPAWTDYVSGTAAHANFLRAIPAVGRIELIGHPSLPYGGTGFLVAPDLLMTNRHVAQIFAAGLGTRGLRFLDGVSPGVDFLRERGSPPAGAPFSIRDIVMIHPYWDLALLRVEGLACRASLRFSAAEPDPRNPRRMAVIGYPAFDPRNDARVQDHVFQGVYNVKRLQPGLFNGRRRIDSFGKLVDAATHDSSTLGGNSGSVIVDADSGEVLGLHFAGIYKDSNFAVPAYDLAREGRMIDAGLEFTPKLERAAGPWDRFWTRSGESAAALKPSPSIRPPGGQAAAISTAPGSGTIIAVPLQVDLAIHIVGARIAGTMATAGEAAERMVEPLHDPIELPRGGYSSNFVGTEVPMPTPRRPGDCAQLADGSHELKYHHFSVVMHRLRRIALFTAANVDGSKAAKEPEPGHRYTRAGLSGLADGDVERWYTDPRIRGTEQLPDRFFTKDRAAFDKGHLVRREDVAWGKDFAEVRAANGDTYFVTNCSPQVAGFNRSNRRDNWGALEDLVLKQARTERYCLFSGPVLQGDDPRFAGVDDFGAITLQIPRKYWKVVVGNSPEGLKSFAFVLEQDLTKTPLEFAVPEAWRRHMIRLADLEQELDSLVFDPRLHAADQFDALDGGSGGEPTLEGAIAGIEALQPLGTDASMESAVGYGRFQGLPAKIALGEDGRTANLLAPLTFVDPRELAWPVPEGAWLDGASIPKAFWSIIGGPFEGRYREASIIHDHFCITKERAWRDTHRMFHDAMLCRGVPGFKARVMFYAVYRFGPRWSDPSTTERILEAPPAPEPLNDAQAASIMAHARILAECNLTVEEIEQLADGSAAAALDPLETRD